MSEAKRNWTQADIDDLCRRTSQRWELVDGQPMLMAPPSRRHERIAKRFRDVLRARLSEKGCEAEVEMEDFVAVDNSEGGYRRADVAAYCGEKKYDGDSASGTNPAILVEVLSPDASMELDEVTKMQEYMALDSVQAYIIVSQHRRLVTITAKDGGRRIESSVIGEGSFDLSVGEGQVITVSLDDVYGAAS